jgi:ribosomal protein S12 methylthiotransferase accessory factor
MLRDADIGRKLLSSGSHRTRLARETLERVLPLKGAFGITRLANVTGLDRIGIPVYLATRPNSRSVAVSQGKGISMEAAKASALMEAVELWHAENIDRPMVYAPFADIGRFGRPVDVARLPVVEDSRFSETLKMHWIEGFDLASGDPLLVPHELVHADYTHPIGPGHGCFASSTNGLASGNIRLEATCHAICEVVERDALTVWHHLPVEFQARTRIELATVDSAICARLGEAVESAGLSIAVWDLTHDIGIATFLCLIGDWADPRSHVGLGSGTHPDRNVALARSLTEAAQTRMNYITGSRDDLAFEEYSHAGLTRMALAARTLLKKGDAERRFTDVPTYVNETLREDLDLLAGNLANAGIGEIACIDLSKGMADISVMRVVIPGLESPHDDEGFVAGPRALAAARRRP